MSEVRLTWQFAQANEEGYPSVRLPLTFVGPLIEGYPNVRLSLMYSQPLIEGYPNARLSLMTVQALFPAVEEYPMPDTPFPGFGNSTTNPAIPAAKNPASSALPGLTFNVVKRPVFKGKNAEASSGREVRTSYTEWPRWEFELSYEFLEDRSGAESSLKTIMGFYTDMQGSFLPWLFKDPDDYLVTDAEMGVGDGVTTQFYLRRYMGTRGEPIGQVDTENNINIYLTIAEGHSIPADPGPYTVTVTNSASFAADAGVTEGGNPMTRVTGAPGAGQYAVDTTTGIYTFNLADAGKAVVISYRYEVDSDDYTINANTVVFDTAPAEDVIVTASFQFYFVCRFLEDNMDFEKFMDQLWELQSCSFKSILT